ncbi:MAG TPA: VOC family protein [Polyangia bacterium]|jgi:catechol 2,3-dioxygenase-like lactoylglutathione lyase family enzyme
MVDHVSLRVSDIGRALGFYKPALAAIGYQVIAEYPEAIGLGQGGRPDFWLTKTEQPIGPSHVALACSRAQVDAFHAAALAAGGTDNGTPGPRPEYHPHYYASFAFDLDGNNIEAVCHEDPAAPAKAKAVAKASAPKAKAKPKAKLKAKSKAAPKKAAAKKAKPAPKKKTAKKRR